MLARYLRLTPQEKEVTSRRVGTDLGSGTFKYSTSVYADPAKGGNGKIYAAPEYANYVLEIDPTGDKVTTTEVGSNLGSLMIKYRTSVLAGNGKIYAAPCNAKYVSEIDPTENCSHHQTKSAQTSVFHPVLIGNTKHQWLLRTARYIAPHGANYVLEINPENFHDVRKVGYRWVYQLLNILVINLKDLGNTEHQCLLGTARYMLLHIMLARYLRLTRQETKSLERLSAQTLVLARSNTLHPFMQILLKVEMAKYNAAPSNGNNKNT